MRKVKGLLKKHWKLIFVFVFTFLIYLFLGFYINNGDPNANYGFSHAIKMGEVPYRDFNIISTPFYAFFSSLFLLFYDDFIMFLFAQTLLVTIMFYFLFQLFENKSWIVFFAMILFKFMGFSATYNFCCLVMSVIVLYLETKYPKKDFLIGFFLALVFLSKQTTGGFFLLPSFFICLKERKRLLKRVIGFLMPCSMLFIYLLFHGALYDFINLCFLGLFDFGGSNSYLFTIWFFLSIILLGINIIFLIRDKKITDYYGLAYLGFVIPIFDLNHFAYYFVGFVIIMMFHMKSLTKYQLLFVSGLIAEFTLFNWSMGIRDQRMVFYRDINHFKYKYNYEVDYKLDKKLSHFIDQYANYDPILIMYYSMSYNISHDRTIGYFDVFLYGNHGYRGTDVMIDKISKMRDQYFIINMDEYHDAFKASENQFNVFIIDYIISVSKLVDSNGKIQVYYKG